MIVHAMLSASSDRVHKKIARAICTARTKQGVERKGGFQSQAIAMGMPKDEPKALQLMKTRTYVLLFQG